MKRLLIIFIILTTFSQCSFAQENMRKTKTEEVFAPNNLFLENGKNCLLINDTLSITKDLQKFDLQVNEADLYNDSANRFNNHPYNIKNVFVSRSPQQVLITKDNLYAYVRCFLSNSINIIDISKGEIVQSLIIPVPQYMILSHDGVKLYVASFVDQMITDPPIDDCTINGFWSSDITLLTTIDITKQEVTRTDTIRTNIIRKILQPNNDSILYLVGNDIIEFNLNTHMSSRNWFFSEQIFSSEIDNKNNKIFIAAHAFSGLDSLQALDLHSGKISKAAYYTDSTEVFPTYIGLDTAANRVFMQGKVQPYSEVLIFNTVTIEQYEPLKNVGLFYGSFYADKKLGSIFLTKAEYEYPYHYNIIELDYQTLELKNELPVPLTNSWKTILYNKPRGRLYSFQKGGGKGTLSRINPPASLDLIEYFFETGEIYKYVTTEHVFECSYERSMALTTDGNTIIITNSPDNSISIVDLTVSNIEEKNSQYRTIVYPNPARFKIQVMINKTIIDDYLVEVYNLMGQKMVSVQKQKYTMEFEMDISKLPKGQYFIRLFNNDFSSLSRFQKYSE